MKTLVCILLLIPSLVWADTNLTNVGDINFGTESFHYITTTEHGSIILQTDAPDENGYGGGFNVFSGNSVQIISGGDGGFLLQSSNTSDIMVNAGGNVDLWPGAGFRTFIFGDSAQVMTDHGLQLTSLDSAPTCNEGRRGTLYYLAETTGVADKLQVCVKLSDDTYAWRNVSL